MADGTTQGYSKDSLQEAVKDILNRKIDITQACDKYKIPKRTLQHHVK